eukprot:7379925-Prymnesium_polylepis.1
MTTRSACRCACRCAGSSATASSSSPWEQHPASCLGAVIAFRVVAGIVRIGHAIALQAVDAGQPRPARCFRLSSAARTIDLESVGAGPHVGRVAAGTPVARMQRHRCECGTHRAAV